MHLRAATRELGSVNPVQTAIAARSIAMICQKELQTIQRYALQIPLVASSTI
jgi:hypothetical protein